MTFKKENTLEIALIEKRLRQLKEINKVEVVGIPDLANELGVRQTTLMDLIEAEPKHFITESAQKGKKVILGVSGCFSDIADNPRNVEYVEKRKLEYAKTIQINYYNNYGSITGFYIEPSNDTLKSQYLNTIEKIMSLKNRLSLKPAGYSIGGFGDSRFYSIENGFEITGEQLNLLILDGWTVVGEFRLDTSNWWVDGGPQAWMENKTPVTK